MNWALVGGSFAAVLGMAGFAWLLGLGREALIADEDAARMIAETTLSGFASDRVWLSTAHDAAAVRGTDGSIALVRRHGARFVTRKLVEPDWQPVDELALAIADDDQRPVTIRLADRAAVAALAGVLSSAAAARA